MRRSDVVVFLFRWLPRWLPLLLLLLLLLLLAVVVVNVAEAAAALGGDKKARLAAAAALLRSTKLTALRLIPMPDRNLASSEASMLLKVSTTGVSVAVAGAGAGAGAGVGVGVVFCLGIAGCVGGQNPER